MIRFSGILLRFSSLLTTIRSGSSEEPCISCGDSRTGVTRISEGNDEAHHGLSYPLNISLYVLANPRLFQQPLLDFPL
ncbi:hypothetical protein Lal_00003774 [Lupinus albus]|nr:hypothetical protein Lal_00003774 [Lupinus albus]